MRQLGQNPSEAEIQDMVNQVGKHDYEWKMFVVVVVVTTLDSRRGQPLQNCRCGWNICFVVVVEIYS